jgi:hypothetical protein
MIHDWMKEEEKLCIHKFHKRLQIKKTSENRDEDEILYKWFLQKYSKGVPVNKAITKAHEV